MIGPEDKIVGLENRTSADRAHGADDLPYLVLLCRPESATPECVVARASSSQLARAIFNAA